MQIHVHSKKEHRDSDFNVDWIFPCNLKSDPDWLEWDILGGSFLHCVTVCLTCEAQGKWKKRQSNFTGLEVNTFSRRRRKNKLEPTLCRAVTCDLSERCLRCSRRWAKCFQWWAEKMSSLIPACKKFLGKKKRKEARVCQITSGRVA